MSELNLTLTQNFKTLMLTMLCCSSGYITEGKVSASGNAGSNYLEYGAAPTTSYRALQTPFKDVNGSNSALVCAYNNISFSSYWSMNNWSADNSNAVGRTNINIGSGTTASSVDDYMLTSAYTKNIDYTCVLHINNTTVVNSKYHFNGSVNITAVNALTINEFGIFKGLNVGGSTCADFLLARGVFDTPITLAAGESKTIDFAIDFDIG